MVEIKKPEPKKATHRIEYQQTPDGKWNVKVWSTNGNFIVGNNQGYNNLDDAETALYNACNAIAKGGFTVVKTKQSREEAEADDVVHPTEKTVVVEESVEVEETVEIEETVETEE